MTFLGRTPHASGATGLASPLWESNPRHQPYHGCALPTELRGRARQGRRPTGQHSGRAIRLTTPIPLPERPVACAADDGGPRARHDHGRCRRRGAYPGGRGGRRRADPARSTTTRSTTRRPRSTWCPAPGEDQRSWLASRSGAFSALVAEWEDEVVGFASRVAVQGAGGLPDDGRGLGVRAAGPPRPGDRPVTAARRPRRRRGQRLPRRDGPHRGRRRGLAGAPRGLRLPTSSASSARSAGSSTAGSTSRVMQCLLHERPR